jgi:Mrp family chromosome partitioning ATPase
MNEMRRPQKPLAAEMISDQRGEPDSALIVWDGLFGFLKRRRRTILATAIAVTVIGIATILLVPWSYKATAIVTLNAYPAIPENPNIHTPIPQTERIQREIQGLQSRDVAGRVIEKLRLEKYEEFDPDKAVAGNIFARAAAWVSGLLPRTGADGMPSRGEVDEVRRSAVVDVFMEKLTVTPVLTSEQIQVTFSSRDPRIAYLAANGVVDTYIESASGLRGQLLQKAADAIQERISSVRDELRDLPVSAGGVNTERQLEAKRTLLQAYIGKLGELLLMKSAIEPRVFVQSRAVYPLQRAGVPLTLGIPVLIIAGVLMGIGVGLVQEGRQKMITSASQVEALLGLRVLAVAGADPNGSERILAGDPKRLARASERIAMELLMARENGRSSLVAFAAPSQSEAKSAICVSVARALARSGHRTLVVDATLSRSSAQARLAAKSTRQGAVSAGGEKGAPAEVELELRRDASGTLDILVTDLDHDSAASEYEKAVDAVQKLAASYEFTLMDIPPVGENPEARYLARHADLAIFVMRRDHDRRDAARAAVAMLRARGVAIIGAVLTRGTFEQGGVLTWAADRLGLRA